MFWIWVIGALVLGMVIGFCLGVLGSRKLIEEERRKALELATKLIESREQMNQPKDVHPSISHGGGQQFYFDVILGGGYGTEE